MNTNTGIVATFTDRFGETRKVHFTKTGFRKKRETLTPILLINREIGELIGQRVRTLRQERGLTMAALCQKAGLVSATPKSRMWEIEKGVRKEALRIGTIYALAIALGVEPQAILPSVDEVKAQFNLYMKATDTLSVEEKK